MSTAKQIVRNSIWLLTATVIMRVIAAFVVVLFARGLGPEGFGQYSFAVAFVSFFSIIANFGFTSLLIRDIAQNKSATNRYINNILTLKIFFGLAAFATIYLSTFFINKPPIVIITICILGIELIVGGFTDALRALFRAHENMKFDALTQIGEKFLWAGLLLFVIFNQLTLLNIALAVLISSTLGLVIAYIFVKRNIGKIGFAVDTVFWKSLIVQAWPFALMGLFSLVNFKIDQVMLSFMRGDLVVGVYSAAYKIIDILAIIPSLLLTSLYPVFSRLKVENKALLRKTVDISLRYVVILAIPVVTGVFLLADKIIALLYGTQYTDSVSVLKILIFISLISFINSPLFVLLNAIGKQKITMINTAFTAAVNISANILLIPRYGINGAAIATIIAEITFLCLSYYQLRKSGFELNLLQKAFKPVVAGIIMGIGVLLMINLNIFIIISFAALIYFTVLLLLQEFDKNDKKMIYDVLNRGKK